MPKILIVNADDLGLCDAVNRAVIHGHLHGIITSASLMVRHPASASAAELTREHPRLSIGLHLDLGEWRFVDDQWQALYEVVSLHDASAVEAEIRRQLDWFHQRVGRLPTHLDSHQHVHRKRPLREIVGPLAADLKIPVRHLASPAAYCGKFYGQSTSGASHASLISPQSLAAIVARLPQGVTELVCHPADEPIPGVYGNERPLELAALCDPRVRQAIDDHGVVLRSFNDAL